MEANCSAQATVGQEDEEAPFPGGGALSRAPARAGGPAPPMSGGPERGLGRMLRRPASGLGAARAGSRREGGEEEAGSISTRGRDRRPSRRLATPGRR